MLLRRCCSAQALRDVQFEAVLSCGAAACHISMTADAATGEITCTYTAAAPGMYRLQLTSGDRSGGSGRGSECGAEGSDKSPPVVHLAGSPFSVQVPPVLGEH